MIQKCHQLVIFEQESHYNWKNSSRIHCLYFYHKAKMIPKRKKWQLTYLPFLLLLTAFVTSRLSISSKCLTNSRMVNPGKWIFNTSNNFSVGLLLLLVSKVLKSFLGMSNSAASLDQFFKPLFCMSSKKAISPITSVLFSNKLHTKVSSAGIR